MVVALVALGGQPMTWFGGRQTARARSADGRGAGNRGGGDDPETLGETAPDATAPAWSAADAEAEILGRLHSDPEAFGDLYDLFCDRIHEYVYRRLRDRAAADDVTAEVFFKALRAIDGYRPGGPPFGAWLYRIASNAVVDHLRARRPTVNLDDALDAAHPVDRAPSVEDQVIDRVEADRVWAAVDTLTDAQRTAVRLRFAEDLTVPTIAERMERTEGAVKLLLNRAMSAIRAQLDAAGPRTEGRA
jgi:RNA polymerase sigma-70 factor, ECF subfamily